MSRKKTWSMILLILAILILAIAGVQLRKYYQVENRYLREVNKSRYMMHALGGVDGEDNYTNSIDALEKSYAEGNRLFEVDVNYTSDEKLVLVHGWKKKDYNERIGMENCDAKILKAEKQYIPDYETFMNFSIQGKYRASDFEMLLHFMMEHKDMFVLIDTGNRDYDNAAKIYGDMVAVAKESGAEKALTRLIVGGHTRAAMDAVRSVYDFKLFNFYFAKDESREEEVFTPEAFIKYCKDNGFQSFSIDTAVFTDELAEQFRDSGLLIYAFTINEEDEAQRLFEKGAAIVGTDFLR